MKQFSLMAFAVLFSMPLLAHTGHGSDQPLAHSVEHAFWLLGALLAAASLWCWRTKKEKPSAVKKASSRK